MEYEVKFDSVGQKFTISLDKSEAILAYTEINDVWDIHTVIVPEEHRGQGIAEYLSLYVFNFAKERNIKIIPTCPYLKETFLKKHTEFRDILEEDLV